MTSTASMVAMLGSSMAAPLAMPPTVKSSPAMSTCLDTVSVVMMASAAWGPPSAASTWAAAVIPADTVPMGRA